MKEYLTRKEAAELLKVNIRTVDNLIKRGVLKKYKHPNLDVVRVSAKEVNDFFCMKHPELPTK
jgi:excisionase family DNA binding protein